MHPFPPFNPHCSQGRQDPDDYVMNQEPTLILADRLASSQMSPGTRIPVRDAG